MRTSGGRISGGSFPRPTLSLGALLLGASCAGAVLLARPPQVNVRNEAPRQVFNAPVKVSVSQTLPAEPGVRVVSAQRLQQADIEARRAVAQQLVALETVASTDPQELQAQAQRQHAEALVRERYNLAQPGY